jgi:hypothetical protein
MIQIFNGRSRGLGQDAQHNVNLQVSVQMRQHLHHFNGSGAYQLWYHVWLVDFQTKQVIARSHFQGGLPPGTKGAWVGERASHHF